MNLKVRINNLYKIFGKSPSRDLALLREGMDRDELFNNTGSVAAVTDVSFDVLEGEVFMVMGLSGSGKSTLVRCINRLHSSTSGEIFIDDEDILKVSDQRLREIRRTKMAMVFQHFALFPHKSVAENVAYGLKIRGASKKERQDKALETLATVGLADWADRSVTDLSGGMQQRVGLARALANDPDILLMDEAFSALDPLIRRDMQDELINLQQTLKKTIIFITHDLHEALKMGDRIAVMKDGAIVQVDTPEDIISNPADDYVKAFTVDVNRGTVLSVASLMMRPEALRLGRDTIRSASYNMRHLSRDALFIVDDAYRPSGIVTDDIVEKALREHHTDLKTIMRTDFTSIDSEAMLSEALPACADGIPLAVTNAEGKLIGSLDPLDVLDSVTHSEEDTDGGHNGAGTPLSEGEER